MVLPLMCCILHILVLMRFKQEYLRVSLSPLLHLQLILAVVWHSHQALLFCAGDDRQGNVIIFKGTRDACHLPHVYY